MWRKGSSPLLQQVAAVPPAVLRLPLAAGAAAAAAPIVRKW
jgi:hypothetical protein